MQNADSGSNSGTDLGGGELIRPRRVVGIHKCCKPFQILPLSEYRVPSSCNQLTFDYNLFFIFIDKSNCATKIFDCPSLLVATLKAEYTVGKAPINIMASRTELEILPSLTFSIPKYCLWIHRDVCHFCTVVFCRLMV